MSETGSKTGRKTTTGAVFQQAGTIAPPGPVGRLVRIVFAYGCWQWLEQILRVGDVQALDNLPLIAMTGFAAYLSRYTVNIGLGWSIGNLPRIVSMMLLAGAAGWGFSVHGQVMSEPLLLIVKGLNIYVFAHLGVSFVLAGLMATPGCEMRAIPILLNALVGKTARDHHCPGPIRMVDDWEAGYRSND